MPCLPDPLDCSLLLRKEFFQQGEFMGSKVILRKVSLNLMRGHCGWYPMLRGILACLHLPHLCIRQPDSVTRMGGDDVTCL